MHVAAPQNSHLIERLKVEKDEEIRDCVNELLSGILNFDPHSSDAIEAENLAGQLLSDEHPKKKEILDQLEGSLMSNSDRQKLQYKS